MALIAIVGAAILVGIAVSVVTNGTKGLINGKTVMDSVIPYVQVLAIKTFWGFCPPIIIVSSSLLTLVIV